ncbi:hypothetical protein MRS44_000411 [Fusarium solani]|jgi:hypothetical protein|uniref:uncharacterized protein n=1 Tax=Fusarium solani TaxID=169388 RepID=UPI002316D4F3|nr:hypothetical protein MRS44_000411 [Fusarium solani]KAJ4222065.1 hypothetical protein NW759_006491 [Fusarium solani]
MLVPERSDKARQGMASGTGPLNGGERRLKRGLRLADEDTEPKTGLYIKDVVGDAPLIRTTCLLLCLHGRRLVVPQVLARRGQADTVGYQEIPKTYARRASPAPGRHAEISMDNWRLGGRVTDNVVNGGRWIGRPRRCFPCVMSQSRPPSLRTRQEL